MLRGMDAILRRGYAGGAVDPANNDEPRYLKMALCVVVAYLSCLLLDALVTPWFDWMFFARQWVGDVWRWMIYVALVMLGAAAVGKALKLRRNR